MLAGRRPSSARSAGTSPSSRRSGYRSRLIWRTSISRASSSSARTQAKDSTSAASSPSARPRTSPSRASTRIELRLQRAVQSLGDRAAHPDLLLLERLDRQLDVDGVPRRRPGPGAGHLPGGQRPHPDPRRDDTEQEPAEHLGVARRLGRVVVHAEGELGQVAGDARRGRGADDGEDLQPPGRARWACTAARTAMSTTTAVAFAASRDPSDTDSHAGTRLA